MPRKTYPKRFTQADLDELKKQHEAGWSVKQMADHWGKDTTSIKYRITAGFKAALPFALREEARSKLAKEDYITARDPVTGKDLIKPEKINRGKDSYLDYLRILAEKSGKKVRNYFYRGDRRADESE